MSNVLFYFQMVTVNQFCVSTFIESRWQWAIMNIFNHKLEFYSGVTIITATVNSWQCQTNLPANFSHSKSSSMKIRQFLHSHWKMVRSTFFMLPLFPLQRLLLHGQILLTGVFSWDLITNAFSSFFFSNFHNTHTHSHWWSEICKDCSEKTNQILEITITYVKLEKTFRRKFSK